MAKEQILHQPKLLTEVESIELLKQAGIPIMETKLTRSKKGAQEMIREIKGYPILEGYRGQELADISALEELIVKVSQFVEQNPQIKELDLNPIFAYKDKAIAVDARIILEG